MGTVPDIMDVIASIAPHGCAIETAARLKSGVFKETSLEEEELHAKLPEFDKPTWEYSAISEVPRKEATKQYPDNDMDQNRQER